MDDQLLNALQIRYIKLHFSISFTEDAILPVHKVSAIRGGMGEMLLRANCIRDCVCESCDFETECIVRRTMYSKFSLKPNYVTNGESIGYVLECENYQTFFPEGETLSFNLILFGNTIVYFNQYLQAFYMLGRYGIGAGHAKFIYMLDCFEGINNNFYHNYQVPIPEMSNQKAKHVKVCRYSFRQGHMSLHGITGFIQLKELYPETIPVLLAGELIHIGKIPVLDLGVIGLCKIAAFLF